MKFLFILICFAFVRKSSSFERILDGIPVKIEKAPYFVHIVRNSYPWCGASILSATVILTAAHCFDKHTSKIHYDVYYSSDINKQGPNTNIKTFTKHAKYNGKSEFGYDVAVAMLANALPINTITCSPIKISNLRLQGFHSNDKVMILGMGNLQYGGDPSKILLGIELPHVSPRNCKLFINKVEGKWNPTQMCFGNMSIEGHDPCQGDSGGPVVFKNTLIAIVSWGSVCGKGYPGVYTNVHTLIPWILEEGKKFDPNIVTIEDSGSLK